MNFGLLEQKQAKNAAVTVLLRVYQKFTSDFQLSKLTLDHSAILNSGMTFFIIQQTIKRAKFSEACYLLFFIIFHGDIQKKDLITLYCLRSNYNLKEDSFFWELLG